MPAAVASRVAFKIAGTGIEEGDDNVELLRDQAFDIGDLLLGLELAVGVARPR